MTPGVIGLANGPALLRSQHYIYVYMRAVSPPVGQNFAR